MNDTHDLRAVVFDLDGLIANTEDLYELAGDDILGRRGKTHDQELRVQMMGRPVADSFQIMIDYHALPDQLDDVLREVEDVLSRLMATSLAAMPGVYPLIDKLEAADIPIAIATSGTRSYADNVLTRLGLGHRFRFILTAEDIHRGKPDPEVYQLAAARLQLAPPAMMVLEDSGNGCAAAVAAGAFTVAVPNRHTRQHDFSGARLLADTLSDPRIGELLRLSAH
jgi:HAD superfamily hydrolase (TIGR01509 family)